MITNNMIAIDIICLRVFSACANIAKQTNNIIVIILSDDTLFEKLTNESDTKIEIKNSNHLKSNPKKANNPFINVKPNSQFELIGSNN